MSDWLRHDLVVSGPLAEVEAFAAQAAGPGAIPWQSPDLALREEDQVLSLLRPPDGSPGLSLIGARALARQLRSAVERHEQRVRASQSTACPLDLHRLCPVPEVVLRLGPHDPASEAWLVRNWGTGQALRHVMRHEDADRRRTRTGKMTLSFWSADWTPWAALSKILQDWPAIVIDVRPDYVDGAPK